MFIEPGVVAPIDPCEQMDSLVELKYSPENINQTC